MNAQETSASNEIIKGPLECVILGAPDYCRRMTSLFAASRSNIRVTTGSLLEGWSQVITNRPHVLFIEIGYQHNERLHPSLRKFLAQLRERYKSEIYVVAALTSPEKLSFGGDLLFITEEGLETSGYIDTFIAAPPAALPSISDLAEQALNVLAHCRAELTRRAQGKVPLPPLGQEGWVQSLADPKSRELWMKWLPRYASYTTENPIIIGETGTGKTNLAYALHILSGREGKFVSITPRDFSSSELVQAELFGAVAGAYTGAVDKWGLVKSAEKGTLFIDELQSIDKELQGKLITFIENKFYRRVGSSETIEADVRFVFASNRTLYTMMSSEVLRDDFAYRLERVQLELLPLHMRRLDISAALAYALAKIKRQRPHTAQILGCTSAAYRMLFSHNWPGNLRQLENTVAKLCEIADMNGLNLIDEAAVIQVFESKLTGILSTPSEVISHAARIVSQEALSRSLSTIESGTQRFVEAVRTSALEANGGDIDNAAQMMNDNAHILELVAESLRVSKELNNIK